MNVVQPLGAVFISILILVLGARQARYYICAPMLLSSQENNRSSTPDDRNVSVLFM